MNDQHQPSWRKPFGMFVILGMIAVWGFAVGSFAEEIGRLPGWLQIPLYIVTGIVWIWILPLRSLLAWMETGRWGWKKPD